MERHHAVAVMVSDVSRHDTSVHEYSADAECVAREWSPLGIDEARELTASAYRMPVTAAEQLFVIKTTFITHEAQNALLKLFEEPPHTSRFVLVIPRDLQLLPTLRSRLSFQYGDSEDSTDDVFSEFALGTYVERMSEIETRTKAKDVDWQRAIKQELLAALSHHTLELDGGAKQRLLLVAERLLTRGASNKMLLEELALTLPTRV